MINATSTAIRFTGRVTKDVRPNTVDGTPVTNFTIATPNGMRPAIAQLNGKDVLVYVEATTYLVLSAWGVDAAAAATLKRGQEVSVDVTGMHAEGRIYENKVQADIVGRASAIVPGAEARHILPSFAPDAPAESQI